MAHITSRGALEIPKFYKESGATIVVPKRYFYNLNSLKRAYIGIVQGLILGRIKGDTGSSDYSSQCVLRL